MIACRRSPRACRPQSTPFTQNSRPSRKRSQRVEGSEDLLPNAQQGTSGGQPKLLKDLVDLVGIEPTTSSMPWKRAPSCATGPLGNRENCYLLILAHLSRCVKLI